MLHLGVPKTKSFSNTEKYTKIALLKLTIEIHVWHAEKYQWHKELTNFTEPSFKGGGNLVDYNFSISTVKINVNFPMRNSKLETQHHRFFKTSEREI